MSKKDKKINVSAPEDLDGSFFEGDGNIGSGDISLVDSFDDIAIGDAIDSAIDTIDQQAKTKEEALKAKVSKKRQETGKIKTELGIRPPKQSKFPTQSDDFLSKPASDRAVHVILNQHMSKIYLDGVDFAPRILMGIPAFNKQCKKNAFEHLIRMQEKIREFRGSDPSKAPKWIIISNDSSMIQDRNLLSRLEECKENTHVVAPYGFSQIRASGRWFNLDNNDSHFGCYIQGKMDSNEWKFVSGINYIGPRTRILIAHGPFIAVRGETFMKLDFKEMSEHMELGYYHYMADISLECHKRGLLTATIRTVATQHDDIMDMFSSREVQVDHAYFTSKWQPKLPISIAKK